ncbi:MAG: hypothetical protein AMK75_07960 [Planctomycetes bacterium SM23_65]|nr:MAG: hypothetical protein AMK75_07960 [Planctomycetes bacterium SM23_65]
MADATPPEKDIASQPVHFPFQGEAELPAVPPRPSTVAVVDEEPEGTPPLEEPPTAPYAPPADIREVAPPTGEADAARKAAMTAELESAVLGYPEGAPAVPGALAARPTLRVTLRQAIDIALRRNLKLKQQEEAIAEAEARLREKQNDYGPRLQFDYAIWTWHGLFSSAAAADPDVSGEGTGRAQMTLFLPVWVARRARQAAVRQAVQEVKVAKQDYEVKRGEVVADVVKYYLAVLEADEALTHTRDIVELNRQRLGTLKILRERGQILRNRLLLGQKFMASAKEEVGFREADRELAGNKLKKHLGLVESDRLMRPAAVRHRPPSTSEARRRMRTNNPVLRRLYHERMSAYWTGRVRHFEEPQANIAVRYGASFPKYREFTDDFLTVGLSVNWPVAKMRLDRAKRDQARHRVRQIELEKEIVHDELDVDLMETHASYLKALRRVEAKRLDVSLNEENLRLSRAFRKHGTVDTQEPEDVFQVVVNAVALAEARMEYVKVRYEALGLLADLYQRMGATDELVTKLSIEPAAPGVGTETAEADE